MAGAEETRPQPLDSTRLRGRESFSQRKVILQTTRNREKDSRPLGTNMKRRRTNRRGQSLVEFAIIALVLYLLFAGIVEFGRAFFVSQSIQSAADVMAREIARTPLPAVASFEDVIFDSDSDVDELNSIPQIYSEDFLAIDITDQPPNMTLLDYLDSRDIPIVNRMLVPVMIVSQVNGRTILRYPGALIDRGTDTNRYTVKIPIVQPRSNNNEPESIRWVDVVEDMQVEAGTPQPNDQEDPFNVMSQERGMVQLRINYPFQAATLSAFQPVPNGGTQGNLNRPFRANDASVTELNELPGGGEAVAPDLLPGQDYGGAYGGKYGLGEHGALNSPQLANGFPLRPFRRVITVQAVARREVFQ